VFFIFNSLRTTKAKKFGFRGIFSHNTPTDFAKSVNEDMRRYGFRVVSNKETTVTLRLKDCYRSL